MAAKPVWFKVLTFVVVLAALWASRTWLPQDDAPDPAPPTESTDPKRTSKPAPPATARDGTAGPRPENVSTTDATDALRAIAKKGDAIIEAAFRAQRKKVWVETVCEVTRILRDDTVGHKHQQFIVKISTGRTLKVAHNIDLAPRVPLERGDVVHIYGRYEYEARGGVLHWTHHDPGGRTKGGWIRHEGKTYR